MAKTPGPPKKADAPAQFDMNSRERKGGGKGGPGRGGRTEKRPPSQIVILPAISVDKGEGWIIQKIGKIDQASHTAMGAEYRLIFDGHEALVFDYLSAARERAKEPPPEMPAVAEAVDEQEAAAAPVPGDEGEAAPVPGDEGEAAPVPGDEGEAAVPAHEVHSDS